MTDALTTGVIAFTVGLFLIGVPYALLWAALAGVLRFIPYVGPLIGALAPILVSLAVLQGWMRPALVVALFVALELFTSLVLETLLYAGATGMSKVSLLVAIAFWISPRACEGGLETYLKCGVAAIALTFALPFVARLDPEADEPTRGDLLTSVGIDRGLHLTTWQTTIEGSAMVDLKKGGGARRFTVTTRPPEHGRSGGGLFRQDGAVVGVRPPTLVEPVYKDQV